MVELDSPRRRGGFGPVAALVVLAVLVGGWSAYWWTAKGELEAALTAYQPPGAQRAVGWRTASVDGWPFRLRARLVDARATLPDGVGIVAPVLVAQAYAYSPNRWLLTAPDGLTILRPVAGPVDVRGESLRASVVPASAGRWRAAFDGRDVTFTPRANADPFLLGAAERLQFEFVEGPPARDEAAVLIRLAGGRGAPTGLLTYIGQGGEAALTLDALITRYGRLGGATPARRWSEAGGAIVLREATLEAGGARVATRGGRLTVASDGRLTGALDLTLRGGAAAMAGLAREAPVDDAGANQAAETARAQESDSSGATLRLVFADGRTTIAGFPIGPAPDLF